MSNVSKIFIFFGLAAFQGLCFAESVVLTEEVMQTLAQKSSPRLDEIEAAFLSVAVGENQLKERFAPELFGKYAHAETRQRAIVRFEPVFSPNDQAQIGVRQNMSHGFETSAAIITDQRSAGPTSFSGRFRNATTTILNFTVQMDLWRDLFGRMSKADLESANLEKKKAELEKSISEKAFRLSLRRIYWSLVANNESMKISQELLSSAEVLAKETTQRFKNSVAEADDVARYQALVASRQGGLTYLKYQKEALLKQLQNLVPELSNKDISLGEYDIPATISSVLACTAGIASESKIPYQNTSYDEMVSLIRKNREQRNVVNSRYADMDVKLFGTAKSTGVSADATGSNGVRGSYGGSVDDQTENNRTGYEVGVMFTLPLGDAKKETERTRELYDQKRLDAALNSSENEIITAHRSFSRTINYLNEVVQAQRVSSEQLEKRLRLMRRKYEQARISVNDLVQDQDAYLSSELTTIDVRLQIINTLFDYLVVFPETPCAFNRI
jgi:outer membrane protein TolC